jgi:hypothetical protein
MADSIKRIDRVAGQFEVWLDESFPFAKMKVKVLERSPRDFLAVSNVFIRNINSQDPQYISGLGDSIEEALEDLMTRFLGDVRDNLPESGLSEADFEWSSPEDF